MNHLYIIGNGFDLHHNVMSAYKNFAVWLKKHDYEVFDTYRRVCDYEALWQDFERGMAYVSRSYFLDMASTFLPSLKGREEDDLTGAEIFLAGDWGSDFAVQLVDRLKIRFAQWIGSIKIPTDYRSHMIPLDKNAGFLTFNYTDFLESQYGIDSSRVKYIHGKRGRESNNLIVGHGEDGDEIFNRWYDKIKKYRPIVKKGKKIYVPSPYLKLYREPTCYILEYQHLTERIEVYYDESRKPVQKIIKSQIVYFRSFHDVTAIDVLGFSFSAVDLPYLQTMLSYNDSPQNISWRISKYSDDDEAKALAALKSIGVNPAKIEFFEM